MVPRSNGNKGDYIEKLAQAKADAMVLRRDREKLTKEVESLKRQLQKQRKAADEVRVEAGCLRELPGMLRGFLRRRYERRRNQAAVQAQRYAVA